MTGGILRTDIRKDNNIPAMQKGNKRKIAQKGQPDKPWPISSSTNP